MLAMSGLKLQEQTGVMEDDFVRSLHPDDEAMVTAAVQRSLDGVADYDIEYRIIRRDDGAVRDINARALVIRDEAGKPIKMTGVAMDVTEQKRNAAELQLAYTTLELRVAERTLTLKEANEKLQTEIAERERAQAKTRESEAFITTVMSNMVDALITIDENGRISSFNQAAEDIFGYDVDDIVGQKINILMPEPDHSEHDRYIADYMRQARQQSSARGPAKSRAATRMAGF